MERIENESSGKWNGWKTEKLENGTDRKWNKWKMKLMENRTDRKWKKLQSSSQEMRSHRSCLLQRVSHFFYSVKMFNIFDRYCVFFNVYKIDRKKTTIH